MVFLSRTQVHHGARRGRRSRCSCSTWCGGGKLSEEFSLLWVVASVVIAMLGFSTPLLQVDHARARDPLRELDRVRRRASRSRPSCCSTCRSSCRGSRTSTTRSRASWRCCATRSRTRAVRAEVPPVNQTGRLLHRHRRSRALCVWLVDARRRPARGRCQALQPAPTTAGFVAGHGAHAARLLDPRGALALAADRRAAAVARQPVQRHDDRLHGQQRAAVPARRVRARPGRWRGASGLSKTTRVRDRRGRARGRHAHAARDLRHLAVRAPDRRRAPRRGA